MECEEVFILFFRGWRFQVVPRRAFADSAAVLSFHDILLRKIGPRGITRK